MITIGEHFLSLATTASDCSELPGWEVVGWNARESAGSYGTLAALLAGFSISGLLWIASASDQPSNRIPRSSGVIGVWASLVPLVLATLLFAEIEGDEVCRRSVIENAVATFLLTIGAVSVFLSIGNLLYRAFNDQAEIFASIVSWAALFFGSAGIYAGNSTLLTTLNGEGWETSRMGVAHLILLTAGYVLAMVLVILRSRRKKKQRLGLFVGIIIASTVAFSLFYFTSFQDTPEWMPEAIGWGRVLMWVLFALAAAALIHPSDVESKANSSAG